jgi:hypothetical protein
MTTFVVIFPILFYVALCLDEPTDAIPVDHIAFRVSDSQYLSLAKFEVAKQFFLDALRERVTHPIRSDSASLSPLVRSVAVTLAIEPMVGAALMAPKHGHYDGERRKDSFRIQISATLAGGAIGPSDMMVLVLLLLFL